MAGASCEGSAAACFTSCMVTVPSGPLARTRAMSMPSFFAIARTAGTALTPPTAIAASLRTESPTCIAPTTVPASGLAAASAGASAVGAGAGGVASAA